MAWFRQALTECKSLEGRKDAGDAANLLNKLRQPDLFFAKMDVPDPARVGDTATLPWLYRLHGSCLLQWSPSGNGNPCYMAADSIPIPSEAFVLNCMSIHCRYD